MSPRQGRAGQASPFPSERELIVLVRREARLNMGLGSISSMTDVDVAPLSEIVLGPGISFRPLFGSEERLRRRAADKRAMGVELPDLSVFYRLTAADERLHELAGRLAALDVVEAAYVKPGTEPPVRLDQDVAADIGAPPVHTPDFVDRQGYLDPAPGGVDARYAWTVPGGTGQGVSVIDIEGAWRFTHEDLLMSQGGVAGGTPSSDLLWRNHGSAVIGEFSGDVNSFGITGICPDANVRGISIFGADAGSARAITQAADLLGPGDVVIIELHRPGPRHQFQLRADQLGYIAIEWWEDDFQAIRYATSRGILVAEAAGNGAEDLDDPLYSTRPGGFPEIWTNPFDRSNRDSGAIVVGAGAPRPAPTVSTCTGRIARAWASPTTAPPSTPRVGGGRSRPPGTATFRVARTRTSGIPTASRGRRVQRRS